jgi:hypothetical protein
MTYVHRHGKKIAVDVVNASAQWKQRRPFAVRFVKLPDLWIERLERSNNPGTFKLAHHILKDAFKRQYVGGEIVLSTEATGLSRKVRFKAVKELVGLGLIQTKQSGNQAVRVTNLLLREEEKKE